VLYRGFITALPSSFYGTTTPILRRTWLSPRMLNYARFRSVAARAGHGGTAPVRVVEQLARAIEHASELRAFSREGSLLDDPGDPSGPDPDEGEAA